MDFFYNSRFSPTPKNIMFIHFKGTISRNKRKIYLQLLATMEVNIVLPAVPGLVLVREPGVEGDCLLQGGFNELGHLPL